MTSAGLVPQMDPGAFYRAHRVEVDAAVRRVLDSGRYILGAEVEAFEREFAAAFGLGHAVGVATGTDALVLAMRALGLRRGDRVATVSHTAVATVAAIELAGGEPVLVDIDPASFTLAPDDLAAAFEAVPGIRGVVAVHLYGHPADMMAIGAIAKRWGAWLVEDCAQAHGARLDDRSVGCFGDAATFSFYPTKNLGGFGDGGLVATADARIADELRSLRQYGWSDRRISETVGMNSRLDEMQAAILRLRLTSLEEGNARRRAIAARYHQAFGGLDLALPSVSPGATHAWHQYVVRHARRDALRASLVTAGIGTTIHYPEPVHRQPAYWDRLLIGPGGLRRTEDAAATVLSLPIYPELDDASVRLVENAVRGAVGGSAHCSTEPA